MAADVHVVGSPNNRQQPEIFVSSSCRPPFFTPTSHFLKAHRPMIIRELVCPGMTGMTIQFPVPKNRAELGEEDKRSSLMVRLCGLRDGEIDRSDRLPPTGIERPHIRQCCCCCYVCTCTRVVHYIRLKTRGTRSHRWSTS